MNWRQHAKNQAISSFCSGDTADIKMVQSGWMRVFWPISHRTRFFPNMGFTQENSI